jgi:hypothetical protein
MFDFLGGNERLWMDLVESQHDGHAGGFESFDGSNITFF